VADEEIAIRWCCTAADPFPFEWIRCGQKPNPVSESVKKASNISQIMKISQEDNQG
jgi:hypothetical protein